MQGESTELILTSDTPLSVPENLKDLSQNFMIAGQQQRQSSSFINGVGSTTYELAFFLFPLRQGELNIPSLKIGQEQTHPLTLKVVNKKQNTEVGKDLPPLELSASVSNTNPYIGQTIFYTLTLIDGQGVVGGEIIPSKIEGVKLSQIGQDNVNSILKDGKRVNEIVRTYTLVADRTGNIEIPPALFNGEASYQAPRTTNKHKFFGIADAEMLFGSFFNTTRPVSFTSNSVIISVQPKPANISGWWLPSSKVELYANYQIPNIVQVGDTLSLNFTLTAQDVNANDMPIPRLMDSADFRIYPQPEERTTTIVDGHLQGKVNVSFMLIPLKVGQMEIPSISVGWFNTQTKQSEKASVPARPITVEQGRIAPVIGSTQQEAPPPPKPEQEKPEGNLYSSWWIWALGTGLFILVIGIITLFWRYKKTHPKTEKKKPLPDFYAFK